MKYICILLRNMEVNCRAEDRCEVSKDTGGCPSHKPHRTEFESMYTYHKSKTKIFNFKINLILIKIKSKLPF